MMPHDLVIKNGMVIDGTGFARYRADVAIKDGAIVEMGRAGRRLPGLPGCRVDQRRNAARRRRPALTAGPGDHDMMTIKR
jgi:urease alpha subunit